MAVPEAENIQVAPRQRRGHPRDRGAAPFDRAAVCGSPKQSHRICPTCGTIRAAKSSRSASPASKGTRDPDCGRCARRRRCAGRGRRGRARGAAGGIDASSCTAPAGSTPAASRSSSGRRSRHGRSPPRAVRAKPDSTLSPPYGALPTAMPMRSSPHGTPARCSPPGLLHLRRLPGDPATGDRRPDPAALRRLGVGSAGRTPTTGPSTCSSSATWARSLPSTSSTARIRPSACLDRREPEKGDQLTLEAHQLLREASTSTSRRQRRGPRPPAGGRRRDRRGRVHRQPRAEAARGTIAELLDALREEISSTTRASSAAS